MKYGNLQTSDTFLLSAVLSLSGGLQDAYTYFQRGEVFANAQTGNVVLMSQHFMRGQWAEGLHYLLPLAAFILGVFVAEQIGHSHRGGRFHWRQLVLLIETPLLLLVGFLPTRYNMPANMLVSFVCAMQVQSFRKLRGNGYASTMCIGNLRSATEHLSSFVREREKKELVTALQYYCIILIFAVGAGLGAILTGLLGLQTIWISCGLLLIACVMMTKEHALI